MKMKSSLWLLVGASSLAACGGSDDSNGRTPGQSEFVSAPMGGGGGARGGAENTAAPSADGKANLGAAKPGAERKVEETDIYRLEGNRLYFLNAYRGLMVFDVTNVDAPKLLGRSPIYGSPVEMIVRDGIATVVVADWYGTMDNGSPFHGSIVRGIDAKDPNNIRILGEAKLGGWVRDTRVVGDVLYAVSEDYGWAYGWDYAYGGEGTATSGSSRGPNVVVSSVSFAGGRIEAKGEKRYDGYSGIFNVTPTAIVFASDIFQNNQNYGQPTGQSRVSYLDISDAAGTIRERGSVVVNSSIQGYGQDNGRWNIDFSDRVHARVIGCSGTYCGNAGSNFVLSTVDFSNPDAPTAASELRIPNSGYMITARFDGNRMYVAPDNQSYSGTTAGTPVQIYDLTNAAAPVLAGQTTVNGALWAFFPAGDRVFALGNDYGANYSSNKVTLHYLDVADATSPKELGVASFGEGWAWTPAAGTFKAFARKEDESIVAIPFSGWNYQNYGYSNGLQIIEYTPSTIAARGVGKTKGWVERGIFVKGRLVSISDQALSVVDYSNKTTPVVVSEITLARNAVSVVPQGNTVAELSTEFWGNDDRTSELRVGTPQQIENDVQAGKILELEGTNARMFRNGNLGYVVTNVRESVPCGTGGSSANPAPDKGGAGGSSGCFHYAPQVSVVDFSGGQTRIRGKVRVPANSYGYYGWGGCYAYDWFYGDEIVKVGESTLAFREYRSNYDNGTWTGEQRLHLVDLSNADAPQLGSTIITRDPQAWWGNMRAVGTTLYTSHYEWVNRPDPNKPDGQWTVKYYLDRIDLSDKRSPRVASSINVPGVLVGASEQDPSVLYFMDYRYNNNTVINEFDAVRLVGDRAVLQSVTKLPGYTGNVFVRGSKALTTVERYQDVTGTYRGPRTSLHEIDLTNPTQPVDRATNEKAGWGWLLGVEGDRAIVTSGWSGAGLDIYKLASDNRPPQFDQFVRTRGYWTQGMSRQGQDLYLASGYWGVQHVTLR